MTSIPSPRPFLCVTVRLTCGDVNDHIIEDYELRHRQGHGFLEYADTPGARVVQSESSITDGRLLVVT